MSYSQPTLKPNHGVAVSVDVTVISEHQACVFVSLTSTTPVEIQSVDWMQGDWLTDSTRVCKSLSTRASFVGLIPAASTHFPVVIKATWQMDSETFTAIRQWSAIPDARRPSVRNLSESPAATDSLFIIRIGE